MMTEINTESQNTDNLEDNTALIGSELTQAIKDSIQSLVVERYREGQIFLAIGSKHGDRRMLQINLRANEIPTLLRARSVAQESNNPNSGKNRPIDNKHVDRIKNYIRERARAGNKWILGTITANVDPSKIKYQNIWGDLYVVFIYNSTALEITDGQHRKKAIEELIFEGEDRDLISQATFPVNLVLEGELEQCQTDFRDMAQTLPIPQSLLVAYGGYGKEAIAKQVVEQVKMFSNKTQKIKSSPGSKTGYIYTINYIAKLVSCSFAGNPSNKLSEVNTNELLQERAKELSDCLNYFFDNYSKIANESERNNNWRKIAKLTGDILEKEKLYWKQATEYRDNCILGISVGLETLGDLLYYTLDRQTNLFDRDKVKQLAKEIDWSRQGECWKDTFISPDGKGGIKLNTSRSSVSAAKEQCLKHLGWVKRS